MADKARVQKFFEVAEIVEQYTIMTEQMASQLSARFASEGNSVGAKVAEMQGKIHAALRRRILDFAFKTYEGLLTNDEADQLIEISSLPISKKMRALAPELQQRVVEFVVNNSGELKEEVERIISSVLADDAEVDDPSRTGALPN